MTTTSHSPELVHHPQKNPIRLSWIQKMKEDRTEVYTFNEHAKTQILITFDYLR